jgi:hypothetical protein
MVALLAAFVSSSPCIFSTVCVSEGAVMPLLCLELALSLLICLLPALPCLG